MKHALYAARWLFTVGICLSVLTLTRPGYTAPLKTIRLFVQPTTLRPCPVVIPVPTLQKQYPDFTPDSFVVQTSDAMTLADDAKAMHPRILPSQADDLDGDGRPDEIAFEVDWPTQERRVVTIEYGDPAAIALLRAQTPSLAHALYSRKYEGLGWESDRVAWRLYDDKRNAIDLYGKPKPGLSLDYFARPGVDYERDSPYGRDIFWNGAAMGIGSVAAWVNGKLVPVADVAGRHWKILADGPVRAVAEMTYTDWNVSGRKVGLTSRFTIWARQHWFQHDITVTNGGDLTLVTGLPAKDGVSTLTPPALLTRKQHRYLATWGTQVQMNDKESASVNGDHLGLAVIASHGPLPPALGPLADTQNHLLAVSLHPVGPVSAGRYAVVAGWDQESSDTMPVNVAKPTAKLPDAARSAAGWQNYIDALSPDVFTTAAVEIVGASAQAAASPPLADTDPLARSHIIAAMRLTNDYERAAQASTAPDNGWVRAAYYTGVMALYETTHDRAAFDQALQWADATHWTPSGNPLNADNQCCIQTYAELAAAQKDPSKLTPALAAYDKQMALSQPGRAQWWWADALFMAPPALARVSAVTGDPRYAAEMNKLWWDASASLYDTNDHLFYRDKRYFTSKTAHGQKVFWSRGNGWVMAGTVRVLESLPSADPDYAKFVTLHQQMAARIAGLQGADGLWRTSLLDPDQFPQPETSGSAFFTYALAWGINHHTLDRAVYLPVVQKAWRGLVGQLSPVGFLGSVQGVASEPGPVRPDATQEYAVGAFLLAGSEMVKLADH